jgi:hypothetical protein
MYDISVIPLCYVFQDFLYFVVISHNPYDIFVLMCASETQTLDYLTITMIKFSACFTALHNFAPFFNDLPDSFISCCLSLGLQGDVVS